MGARMPEAAEKEARKPLDARKVETAAPRDKDYKLSDTGGLYLFVSKSGHRTWRLKYRFGGKERRLVLGTFPDVGLKQARALRDDAKFALREGRDPGLERTRARHSRKVGHQNTFEQFAREWHASQVERWKPVHATDVLESMENNLFGEIGDFPVDQIDEGLLLHALRKVEARGAIETAHRLRQRAERVFRHAAANGVRNSNPAVNVKDALKPVPSKKRRPALVDLKTIHTFMRDIDRAAASPVTKLSSRFLALTAQRPGMVREVLWTEISGIDWANLHAPACDALWTVPAAKMKQELDLREDEAFEHKIPLTQAAVNVLRTVRSFSGGRGLVFPGGRESSKPLSENAVGYLYNREGWKGRHVPHRWRSSFSTIMNGRIERAHPGAERLLTDRLVIDLMLAHTPSGMSFSELIYNRHAYMERRREFAEDWAMLILEGADPVEMLLDGRRRRIER
ncbi:integrase arm-type DNA-binding domain-containing protein [Sphingomonas sp. KR1UV-12]|uniref:Integrase arm-type DNA-binding domain-containing protein n=1 Tax=Sphingomonas aurea TaxID=3063994 RepID=A0ABT9EMA0_9SPHN|nr:integrase arm-type DNA-binding domain-containing protein [Sphingomonas sp. KR1UV-12]MDP1027773.1 integrase arm-type DNA-binding domain-containing protein [Sphingomonas sp. KR1UV-12]